MVGAFRLPLRLHSVIPVETWESYGGRSTVVEAPFPLAKDNASRGRQGRKIEIISRTTRVRLSLSFSNSTNLRLRHLFMI